MKKITTFLLFLLFGCQLYAQNGFVEKAILTQRAIDQFFSVPNSNLYSEQYPFDSGFKADYLGSTPTSSNAYSYLWPFSGVLSATVALYEAKPEKLTEQRLNNHLLKGLDNYYDTKRNPFGYASYINTAPQSDRFYDDNIWLGIDFTQLFLKTKKKAYLVKAKEIYAFVMSGRDDKLGDGIYWCEQKKESKNTCSNAPASVFALLLYKATHQKEYLETGLALYQWTKQHLQDPKDFLYFDNINLSGKIDKTKFSYNAGQMLEAAALLFQITKNSTYYNDAENIAASCYKEYFYKNVQDSREILKNGNVWFHAIMLRGFVAHYAISKDLKYLKIFKDNLNFAWNTMRDSNGLFDTDWSGKEKSEKKWLLNQAAFAEMFARLAAIKAL